jgi:hypothetical protein
MSGGSQRARPHQTQDLKDEVSKEPTGLQRMDSGEPALEATEALQEAECETERILQLLRNYRKHPKSERVFLADWKNPV